MSDAADTLEKRLNAVIIEVGQLSDRVEGIEDSMPDKSVPKHKSVHQTELERSVARKLREDEAAKIRFELKKDLVKGAVMATIAAVVGVSGFAATAYFNSQVHRAIDTPPARVEVAK